MLRCWFALINFQSGKNLNKKLLIRLFYQPSLLEIMLIPSGICFFVEGGGSIFFRWKFDVQKLFLVFLPVIVYKQVVVDIVNIRTKILSQLQKRNREAHAFVHAENNRIFRYH